MDGLLDAQMQNALLAAQSTSPAQRSGNTAQTPEAMQQIAEEFEAVFLAQMMEHMMGESTEASFGGGPSENAFKSMLNEEYAKVMAKAGGIGLGDALMREIMALQESTV